MITLKIHSAGRQEQPIHTERGLLVYDIQLVKTLREVTGLGLKAAIGLSWVAHETEVAFSAHIDDAVAMERLNALGPHVCVSELRGGCLNTERR